MQPPRPSFLYDADCGACSKFKGLASFLDASHAIDFVSIQEAGHLGLLDGVPKSLWYSSSRMVSRDGTVTSGGESLLALMSELPVGRLPSMAVQHLPHSRSATQLVYGVLSRVHGSSCATNTLKPSTEESDR